MVGIMPSLKTARGAEGGETDPARIAPRSTAPLDFPTPLKRERSNADLARMIESEIIPRLMLSHSPPGAGPAPQPVGSVGPRTLEAFARMTLASEAHALTGYIETLMQGGLSLEEIYVDLLIPTARRLGDDWNEDFISFTDVTIGLTRLQQVVRTLGHSIPTRDADEDARSVYFVPAPNEQHAFGLVILEDYFRRAGWRTWLDTAATGEDAARTVGHDWFDIFGLSATSDTPADVIASTIAQVRKASRNPRLFVMVGGRLFIDDPALAGVVGADAASVTAGEALSIADNAINRHASA